VSTQNPIPTLSQIADYLKGIYADKVQFDISTTAKYPYRIHFDVVYDNFGNDKMIVWVSSANKT